MLKKLQDKIKKAPRSFGVYLFLGNDNKIIYIGKAKNLYNRLNSYLKYEKGTDARLKCLLNSVLDFDVILTNNEVEALLLESTLIKKHKPKYNVLLKDDKAYPYIKIDIKSEYPSMSISRKVVNDGSLYFGPYTSLGSIKFIFSSLNKIFKLKKCNNNIFKLAKKPCLNYQMGNCLAPCSRKIDSKNYFVIVNAVIDVLNGNINKVVAEFTKEMFMSADSLDFEEASKLKAAINSLNILLNKQYVVFPDERNRNRDVITIFKLNKQAVVNVLYVRNGNLSGQSNTLIKGDDEDATILQRFMIEHYKKNLIPDIINIPFAINDKSIDDFLFQYSGNKKIKIIYKKNKLVDSVKHIASKNIDDFILNLNLQNQKWQNLSKKIISQFELTKLNVIECYDMSNISGKFEVGAKISYIDGEFDKSKYRKYKIKGKYSGNDLQMMEEVFTRRFSGIESNFLPDFILIDGGKTQLQTVYNVAKNFNLESLCFASIAKDKTKSKTLSKDKIYRIIPQQDRIELVYVDDDVLDLFKMIRDETHRFVISYHRKLREKISI